MPTLEEIEGVKIECYSGDHLPPHVHAKYGEYEDLIEINTGNIYTGDLPSKKRKIATNYVANNKKLILMIFHLLNPQLKRNAKK